MNHDPDPDTGRCRRCGLTQPQQDANKGFGCPPPNCEAGLAEAEARRQAVKAFKDNMPMALEDGRKYLRTITDRNGRSAEIDVYDVLKCFDVTDQAVGHAIKKLLCAGKRGKATRMGDLTGARAAVERAIQMCDEKPQFNQILSAGQAARVEAEQETT